MELQGIYLFKTNFKMAVSELILKIIYKQMNITSLNRIRITSRMRNSLQFRFVSPDTLRYYQYYKRILRKTYCVKLKGCNM